MQCPEVRKLLPELALCDLDAEPARAVGEHLKGCAECRAEQAALAATVAALRAPEAPAPSAERREAALAAMVGAQQDMAERLLVRPRRSWLRGAAAAALFGLVVGGAMMLRSPGPLECKVAMVSGQADLFHREKGSWEALASGQAIHRGDRVVTQGGAVVRLDLGAGSLYLDQNTSVDFTGGRRLAMDRGRLYAEINELAGRPLVITDTANNFVALRRGTVEAGLRQVETHVAGSQETPEKAFVPAAKTVVSQRLSARVAEGEADLGGAHDQRLRVTAGQSGDFDVNGQPATRDLPPGQVAPWREPGYYDAPRK